MIELPEVLDFDTERVTWKSQTYKFTGVRGTTLFVNWKANFSELRTNLLNDRINTTFIGSKHTIVIYTSGPVRGA